MVRPGLSISIIGQFHRDFRNTSLLGLVQDRFPKSKLAYLAVKVMLDNSSPTERKVNEQVSASIRYDPYTVVPHPTYINVTCCNFAMV